MVSDGKEGRVQINVAGISSMTMECIYDGFDVPCCRCQAPNVANRLSGDLPEGIAGYYCDSCYKTACLEALEHFQKLFEESTKSLKTTLVSRKDAEWSLEEIAIIANSLHQEVWDDQEHPNHLVIHGHCAEAVFRALPRTLTYSVQNMVGTKKLPFLPFY